MEGALASMKIETHRFSAIIVCLLVPFLPGSFAIAVPRPAPLKQNVVGIQLPQTALARKAATFAAEHSPPFLFNHSVRTYIFGALAMKAKHLSFDSETAFVASVLHDIGLQRQFATPGRSFEVDGANKAETLVKEGGGSDMQARNVWNAIAMHDLGRSFQSHASPEALLVGFGAGSDVDGPDPAVVPPDTLDQILRAYPRLGFKEGFTALAADHCKRKPASQIGWLDNLCREVSPITDRGSVREEIKNSPFKE